ncbi:MAG: hypothetical protein EBU08_21890, partial [Micrococcales bacterium]|nr:hypothetical protein [Micrococcales bacterium]
MSKKENTSGNINTTRTLTAKRTAAAIKHAFKSQRPVMLWGPPGIGKSEVVAGLGKALNRPVIDVRLALWDPTDLKGIPFYNPDSNSMEWAPPTELPQDPDSNAILFFDELNRASKDVLQAVFEICLDRRLDGEKLPDGWRVVAAVNSDSDYDVVELDPALHDRWFHIDFDPSVAEWVSWARNQNIHPAVVEFVDRNQNLLDPPVGNLEAGKVYPSRRSWQAFSDSLIAMKLEERDDGMLTQIAKGWLGREISVMFQKFIINEFSLLRPDDVLDSLEKVKSKVESSCNDIEVIAALARSVVAEVNNRSLTKMKDKQRDNLREFFMMLPNDVASQSWV